jgi:hypothetical protein
MLHDSRLMAKGNHNLSIKTVPPKAMAITGEWNSSNYDLSLREKRAVFSGMRLYNFINSIE